MLQLYTPSLAECRRAFVELAPGVGHIGLDDLFPTERAQFIAEKNRVGDLVLMHHSMSMARQYAKTGCPTSIRVKVQQFYAPPSKDGAALTDCCPDVAPEHGD